MGREPTFRGVQKVYTHTVRPLYMLYLLMSVLFEVQCEVLGAGSILTEVDKYLYIYFFFGKVTSPKCTFYWRTKMT